MTSTKQGLLYLDAKKMYLYHPERGMIPLELPPAVVSDLEVVDRQALNKFIAGLIDTNKLTPLRLGVILAEPLLFRTKIPAAAATTDEAQNQFIATVPFEQVLWKSYGEPGADQEIIATNGSFIEALRAAFETRGWSITSVIPTLFLGELTMTGRVPDAALATETLKRLDSWRQVAITKSGEDVKKVEEPGVDQAAPPHLVGVKPKFKLLILLAVFGVLIIILIVVAVWQFRTPLPAAPPAKAPPAAAGPSPTVASKKEFKDIRVLLIAAVSSSRSALLKSNLEAGGAANVAISLSPGNRAPQALVVMSPLLSEAAKTQLNSIVSSQFTGATFTQDPGVSPDVRITLPSQ